MTDLPDINVWLALVDERHAHHSRARHYWEHEAADQLAFCRVTMLGFLRLSTHAQVMPSPLSTQEAWAIYRQFLALPLVCWLAEPAGTDRCFQELSSGNGFIHRSLPGINRVMPGCFHNRSLLAGEAVRFASKRCDTLRAMQTARFYFAYFWFSRTHGGRESQG